MAKRKEKFVPSQPTPESYDETPQGVALQRLLFAFQNAFGILPGVVSREFKAEIEKVMEWDYPKLRCSSVRAVMEGRIPGIPKPLETVHPQFKRRYDQALTLFDLMETMVQHKVKLETRVDNRKKNVVEDAMG